MSLLGAFNNLLKQFLHELVLTFPEVQEIRTIQTVVDMMRSVHPRMILDNFLAVAGRYHEKILLRDHTFFENLENWKNDPYFLEQDESFQTEVFQGLVVFKDIWMDLTDTNRETLWTYFRQLLIIGSKGNNNALLAERAQQILIFAAKTTRDGRYINGITPPAATTPTQTLPAPAPPQREAAAEGGEVTSMF